MIHGLANDMFLDDKRFWPIFERAQALDVPIYLHPSIPHPAVMDAYYKDYVKDYPMVIRAAWGFTVETATQAIRMVLCGIFDKYPNLKIIIGHLGETLPFLLWRIDQSLSRPGQKSISFRDIFCGHFYLTTSGNFSDPAMMCCVQEMGVDRIMFAVDWPFVRQSAGHGLDEEHLALRRGQGEDPERQRQEAAEDVIIISSDEFSSCHPGQVVGTARRSNHQD